MEEGGRIGLPVSWPNQGQEEDLEVVSAKGETMATR